MSKDRIDDPFASDLKYQNWQARQASASDPMQGNRQVGFTEALGLFLRNYVTFSGRSSRGAFWYALVWQILIGMVSGFVDVLVLGADPSQGAGPLNGLTSLVLFLPALAICIRRLHDVGRSGFWYLLVFTVIGIPVLLWWFCQPGQRMTNTHGADIEAGRP